MLPNRRTALATLCLAVMLTSPAAALGSGVHNDDPTSPADDPGEDINPHDPPAVGPFVRSNGPTPIDWVNATTHLDVDPNQTTANLTLVLILGPTTNDEELDQQLENETSPVVPSWVYDVRVRTDNRVNATVYHP